MQTRIGANPFESLARAAKLQKLLEASDDRAICLGLDPYRDAARIYNDMSGRDFEEVVLLAGVRKPSSVTVEAFLGLLKSRIGGAS